MNDYEEMFRKAEIIVRGSSDPEQIKRAEEILQTVSAETDGSPLAQKARELLHWLHEKLRGPEFERDPVFEQYKTRWTELQGLTDYGLTGLLKELRSQPSLVARLRPLVVPDLRQWASQTVPLIVEGLSEKDLFAITSFMEEISGFEAYRVEELKPLRKALFQLHYQELKQSIEAALAQWAIDEAWKLHKELKQVPEEFEEEVLQLQARIYSTQQLRQAAQEALAHATPKEPEQLDSWLALSLRVNALHQQAGLLAEPEVPREWQKRLENALKIGAQAACTFLKKQAAVTVGLPELRDFWTNYNELELDGLGDRLALQEKWFQASLKSLLKRLSANVTNATTPAQLKELEQKWRENSAGLPPLVMERIQGWAEALHVIRDNWQTMLKGNDFASDILAGAPEALPLPTAFTKAARDFRADLERLTAALGQIRSSEALSEATYRAHAELAEAVLERTPQHIIAGKLKQEAERGLRTWHLDEALRRWDVDEFLQLSQNADGVYRELAQGEPALRELTRLANQAGLSGWRKAADWWEAWRVAKKQLPLLDDAWPAVLKLAVHQQEERRRDEWYGVLETLQQTELEPAEAQQVVHSLEHEMETLHLQGYYAVFNRKAIVGLAQFLIDNSEFEAARAEMAKLDQDQEYEEVLRLRTRFNLEQARASQSVSETAEVLFREWQNIASQLENGYAILLETVQRAWEGGNEAALNQLQQVMLRAFDAAPPESAVLAQLRDWAEWLKVEQALRAEVSPLNVKRMSEYLRNAKAASRTEPRLLRERLERLKLHWEAAQDRVMLAWGYQAFNHLVPGVLPQARDPIEDFAEESATLGEQTSQRLRTQSEWQLAELAQLQADLVRQEKKWKDLKNYLGLLNYPVPHEHREPEELIAAQRECETLQHALTIRNELRQADWRQKQTRDSFEDVHRTVAGKLQGFAVQPTLLRELDQYAPLLQLEQLEANLLEAAEQCGAAARDGFYEDHHFAELGRRLANLIEAFTKAAAETWLLWQRVSVEVCDLVYKKAGILLAPVQPPDLHALLSRVKEVGEQEQQFKRALQELEKNLPPGVVPQGDFDPETNRDYLERFPAQPPYSLKTYGLFKRFADDGRMQTVLRKSRARLPAWVRDYLEKGVPDA